MFLIYGTESCTFCKKAVNLIKMYNLPFSYRQVQNKAELQEECGEDKTTVPQIYYFPEDNEPQYVGGYDELEEFLRKLTKK